MTALSKLPPAVEPQPARLLGIAEIAQQLGVTIRSLRRWMARGAFPGPAFRLPGNRCRWTVAQLEGFLREHTSGVPLE